MKKKLSKVGCNTKSTLWKHAGVQGMAAMTLMMQKNKKWIDQVVIVDTHSGPGIYVNDGSTYLGSPIQIAQGINKVNEYSKDILLLLNDISPQYSEIAQVQAESFLNFSITETKAFQIDAKDMVTKCHIALVKNKSAYMLMFVDPNGPSQIPMKELKAMVTDNRVQDRVSLAVHLSTQALSRSRGLRNNPKYNCNGWIYDFNKLDDVLTPFICTSDRAGWLSQPGDQGNDWMLLLSVQRVAAPKNGWNKHNLVSVKNNDHLIELTKAYKKANL